MASYNIRWKLSAKKELKKLPKETILIRRSPVRIGPGVPIKSMGYDDCVITPFFVCETPCETFVRHSHKPESLELQNHQSNVNRFLWWFYFRGLNVRADLKK
jgi:hypothetical protein